jgi:hypothetical protein
LAVIAYNHSFVDPAVIQPRLDYYQSPLYPTSIFDGTDEVFEPNPSLYFDTYSQHIVAAKADTPLFNLELDATASANTGNLQLKIVTADTIPDDLVLAFVAICQDSIRGVVIQRDFNYVCQQLENFPIDLVYPDSLDTTIIFSHAIPVNQMRAVVFIQDMDTKEVLSAIASEFEEVP